MADRKEVVGSLILLVIAISGVVYITFEGQGLRMRIDNDKSTFYVFNENSRWEVSGREYNLLFDSSSQMNRDTNKISINTEVKGQNIIVTRSTRFQRGPLIVDTYTYRGDVKEKELFPVQHIVDIYNASGYFYRYEVRDLDYSGPTYKLSTETSLGFGKNMKIEFDSGYRWAWVYKSGIFKVQYDIPSDYETYRVRLFDPDSVNLYIEGQASAQDIELGSILNISAELANDTVCIDFDHPSYGVNYSCDSDLTEFNANVTWFRTTTDSKGDSEVNLSFATVWTYQSQANSTSGSDPDYYYYSNWSLPTGTNLFSFEAKIAEAANSNYTGNTNCILASNPIQIKMFTDEDVETVNISCYDYTDDTWKLIGSSDGTVIPGGVSYHSTIGSVMDDDNYDSYAFYEDSGGFWYNQTAGTANTAGRIYDIAMWFGIESGRNSTWNITAHEWDEIESLTFNLTGYSTDGEYPSGILISINGTEAENIGLLFDTPYTSLTTFDDDSSSIESEFNSSSSVRLGFIGLPAESVVSSAYMNITGSLSTRKHITAQNTLPIAGQTNCDANIGNCANAYDGNFSTYAFNDNTTTLYIYENISFNNYDTMNLTFKIDLITVGSGYSGFLLYCYDGETWFFIDDKLSLDGDTSGTYTVPLPSECSLVMSQLNLRYRLDILGSGSSTRFYETRIDYWNYTYPNNTDMEIGSVDGTREYNQTGFLYTTARTSNFSDAINNFTATCDTDQYGFCQVPVYIITDSAGTITLDDVEVNYTYNPNPVTINKSKIYPYLRSQSDDTIIPITLHTDTDGIIRIDDIKYDYAGGNKTYTVLAHNSSYTVNTSYDLTFHYSSYNTTMPVSYIEFIPTSPTAKNVVPYGQTTKKPIFNLTMTGYSGLPINFSVYLNESHSCINLTIGTNSTKSQGTQLTAGIWTPILPGTSYGDNYGLWLWEDFQCNYSSWQLWNPNLYFRGCCDGCDVCDTEVS